MKKTAFKVYTAGAHTTLVVLVILHKFTFSCSIYIHTHPQRPTQFCFNSVMHNVYIQHNALLYPSYVSCFMLSCKLFISFIELFSCCSSAFYFMLKLCSSFLHSVRPSLSKALLSHRTHNRLNQLPLFMYSSSAKSYPTGVLSSQISAKLSFNFNCNLV